MPQFPTVEGEYRVTKEWSIILPSAFKRRVEDDSLVLWRPGITAWIIVWGNDNDEPARGRLEGIRGDSPPDAFDSLVEEEDTVLRYGYRLAEESDDGRVPAFYCFAFGHDSHVLRTTSGKTARDSRKYTGYRHVLCMKQFRCLPERLTRLLLLALAFLSPLVLDHRTH